MKKQRRVVSSIVAALALLLAIAAAAVHVRSYWVGDVVALTMRKAATTPAERRVSLGTGNGVILFTDHRAARAGDGPLGWDLTRVTQRPDGLPRLTGGNSPLGRKGFTAHLDHSQSPLFTRASASAPIWVFIVLFGLYPMVKCVHAGRRVCWRLRGCCRNCGYDLRMTPNRCPECGDETRDDKGNVPE